MKWLDFEDPVCIIRCDQYSSINVCALDSVLSHIGNPWCSSQWLWSATAASISAASPHCPVILLILHVLSKWSLYIKTNQVPGCVYDC